MSEKTVSKKIQKVAEGSLPRSLVLKDMPDISPQLPLALFIDGENIPSSLAEWIFLLAKRYGCALFRGLYGHETTFRSWASAIETYMLETRQHGGGKDAADCLMIQDACRLALEGAYRQFLFVTRDGDLAGCAIFLRLLGSKVYGMGQWPPSTKLVTVCDEYITAKTAKKTVELSVTMNDPLDRATTLMQLRIV